MFLILILVPSANFCARFWSTFLKQFLWYSKDFHIWGKFEMSITNWMAFLKNGRLQGPAKIYIGCFFVSLDK